MNNIKKYLASAFATIALSLTLANVTAMATWTIALLQLTTTIISGI
jgi:hypothetical protein